MRALVGRQFAVVLGLSVTVALGAAQQPVGMRVKDIASVVGLGSHKLIGYGLVVGLEGTGDGRRATFTARAVANMLEQFGITVDGSDLRVENAASVMATADVGPECEVGATIDVVVSSLGDAKSLQGGTLLMTPLLGADGEVYALAQGPISIGGFNASGGGAKVQKNHGVVGRLPAGASVVKALPAQLREVERITLALHVPDFGTARRIAAALNAACGEERAVARSAATVEVKVPRDRRLDLVAFVDEVQQQRVLPDTAAKVVVNERTGTVVIGENVRVLPVAIAHGGLTVEITASRTVSQPVAPFTPSVTVPLENTTVRAEEESGAVIELDGSKTLQDLVTALNRLAVKPRDLIAILQALKAAHALQAEIELM